MMKRGKKGQVAMEFLMTYGWAIIIILVAIAALWYLGVFKTEVPNACEVPAPLTCVDVRLADGGATDTLYFTLGGTNLKEQAGASIINTVTINGVTCANPTGPGGSNDLFSENAHIAPKQFTCTGALGAPDDKFAGTAVITYTKSGQGQLLHVVEANIRGMIE